MEVPPSVSDKLLEMERKLMQSDVRASAEIAGPLIASNFIEIGKSGAVYDKAGILKSLVAETPRAAPSIEDFKARALAPNLVQVIYRCRSVLRSSIWRREGETWQILFHQGTPVGQARDRVAGAST